MVEHVKNERSKGTWLTYRPDIKILDCTIRDGGLINNHHFTDDFVRAVYEADVAAGMDYMEIGYRGSKKIYPPGEHGPWKHCDEEDVRRIVGDNPTPLKLCVMADAERTDYREDILPKQESVFDAVRVATYIHQIPTALDMVHDAHEKGYEVILQLMAVSVIQEAELEEALPILVDTPVSAIYLVDSFGALYSEQVRDLIVTYVKAIEGTGKEIGIHAHNAQQLAYANTIEALIMGASRLDATLNGMGRGPGNCPMELLVGFLKNPKFHIRPVLQCIQDYVLPLKSEMEWGPKIPYMITGQLNLHPRTAIEMRKSDRPDDYVTFYDKMMEEE
ncbi:MAG: aldolase catalytic domain-containing protein [Candidatus Brocadiae bacterium]|nr:aldolase catalytic domain-containing protein [Candidatus Brocadiia bacterium]